MLFPAVPGLGWTRAHGFICSWLPHVRHAGVLVSPLSDNSLHTISDATSCLLPNSHCCILSPHLSKRSPDTLPEQARATVKGLFFRWIPDLHTCSHFYFPSWKIPLSKAVPHESEMECFQVDQAYLKLAPTVKGATGWVCLPRVDAVRTGWVTDPSTKSRVGSVLPQGTCDTVRHKGMIREEGPDDPQGTPSLIIFLGYPHEKRQRRSLGDRARRALWSGGAMRAALPPPSVSTAQVWPGPSPTQQTFKATLYFVAKSVQ